MISSVLDPRTRLDNYYQDVKTVILARQNPISGLLPASTAITSHGDYTDAWVRDNVYSILAVWGLAIAYRKTNLDPGRTYELEHSVIKLMRGLLFAMMKQAPKVEQFKQTQHPLDALHAKYDTRTGDTVVGDDQWGHLQLDATSLYLLMLAQMTASGLKIIFTLDEVNFIQNLVYYIGRTYRTPDYGIWERGNKINHGNPELNASSIGMAKAALEALAEVNLFGTHGGQASALHILPDEIARARSTLYSLLPRESSSKEVDAAVLSIISFPAFAVEDEALVDRTRQDIISKLEGHYGCKRFLRDGHQTVLEDTTRLHYEPWELQKFAEIECEWPLFFTYLLMDGLFRGDLAQIRSYQEKLEFVLVKQNGKALLPELYFVPSDRIDAERAKPHSQTRLPNENIPLVWAQSLYYLGQLIIDGLLDPTEIDPLNRHRRLRQWRNTTVQIALLVEDEALQAELAEAGLQTQTLGQVAPYRVGSAEDLAQIYRHIGCNAALGLSGRPPRRQRILTTSRLFRIAGTPMVFLPAVLDQTQFYLTLDSHVLIDQIRSEIAYIHRHWTQLGQPTITLLLTRTMLMTGEQALLQLFQQLKTGQCDGVPVKLGALQQLQLTAAQEVVDDIPRNLGLPTPSESIPHLHHTPEQDQPLSISEEEKLETETNVEQLLVQLNQTVNLYEQSELLQTLVSLKGLDFSPLMADGEPVSLALLLEEVYEQAGRQHLWAVVRRTAGLLNKSDIGLSDAVTDLLVRRKQISVGRAYSEASLITQPLSQAELMDKLREFCRDDIRDRVLTQEILLYLGMLMRADPKAFQGFLTLRVGYLILLLTSDLAAERQLTQDEAYETLMQLSPSEIKTRLQQVLLGYDNVNQLLRRQESLHARQPLSAIDWVVLSSSEGIDPPSQGWRRQRQLDGTLNRVPPKFYKGVWTLLNHCKGLVIGDKLDRRNRLDSYPLVMEMTAGETNFALKVEHLLNKIQAAEYRQLTIEALMELAAIAQSNPDLEIEDHIVMDILVGHAVRLAWLEQHPDQQDTYDQHKGIAWHSFYETPPKPVAGYIAQSFRYLLETGIDELGLDDEPNSSAPPEVTTQAQELRADGT